MQSNAAEVLDFSEKVDTIDCDQSIHGSELFKLESFIGRQKQSKSVPAEVMQLMPELAYPVLGKFTGVFAKLDSMSANRRFYSAKFWRKVLSSPKVKADLAAGKMKGIYEHPNVKSDYTKDGLPTARHPMNAAFVVKRLWIQGNNVMGEAYLLNTPLGKLLTTYFLAKDDSDVPLFEMFVSARGYTRNDYFDENGVDQMNPEDYLLQSFDIVGTPGIKGAKVKLESDESDGEVNSEIAKLEALATEVSEYYERLESYKDELRQELQLKNV